MIVVSKITLRTIFATLINITASSSKSKLHASSKASPTSFLNESTRLAIMRFRFKCWNMILKFICKSFLCRKSQYSFFISESSKTFKSPPIWPVSLCKTLPQKRQVPLRLYDASFPRSSSAKTP